jgi:hypothetical protein
MTDINLGSGGRTKKPWTIVKQRFLDGGPQGLIFGIHRFVSPSEFFDRAFFGCDE